MRGSRKSSGQNPFQTNHAATAGSGKRSVDLGNPGETPKKFLAFNQKAPPSDIQSILSQSSREKESSTTLPTIDEIYPSTATGSPEKNDFGRPKTGRGKAHPSPDEFFDYVVPSPDTGKIKSNRILIHARNKNKKNTRGTASEDDESSVYTETSASTGKQSQTSASEGSSTRSRSVSVSSSTRLADNYMLGLNMEGVARDKQIALLGCWLFGSALKI